MAKHYRPHSQSTPPVPRGFMEPTAGATHYEDIYGVSQLEEDRVESYAFDVCNDDGDDDEDDDGGNGAETLSNRRRVTSGPSTASRGVIKKPKYKSRLEIEAGNKDNPLDLTTEDDEEETVDPHTQFKISPRENPKHSVSVTSAASKETSPDNIQGLDDKSPPATSSPSDSKAKRNAEAFTAEKSKQRSLTSSARFALVRKQRLQVREEIHAACGKARKVKEGARRDAAAAAQACLVVDYGYGDVLLGSREPYVLVERSEAPSEYVDFTTSLRRVVAKGASKSGIAKSAGLGKKKLSLMKNWKGEEMGLARGAAYVFVVVSE